MRSSAVGRRSVPSEAMSEPVRPDEIGRAEVALLRVAEGDRAAFPELYDRFAGKVYGLSLRVLRNNAHAEEVTQETMLEVWRKATQYDPARGSAAAWIMTIAHRKAIDRVRSEQSARRREERVAVRDLSVDDPGEAAELSLNRERLRNAMVDLTDLEREAIELAYYGGYTYREVADRLGAPLGTVKTRMRAGLARLRVSLGDVV